jgi:transcriptional antiterminator RfaH
VTAIPGTAPQWYALQSKPCKEEALWKHLESRGVDAFYPFLSVKPVNPRARKRRPFYPGYLFVRADLQAFGLQAFRGMPHAKGIVCFGSEPAPVPEAVIQGIRRRLAGGPRTGEYADALAKRGDPIRVADGLFCGHTGLFDTRVSGAERVRVLLQLLGGRSIAVELDSSHVQTVRRS